MFYGGAGWTFSLFHGSRSSFTSDHASPLEPPHDQGIVLAAEAEIVRDRDVHLRLPRRVGNVVEVALRVGFIVGGSLLSRIARTHVISSTAPAAAMRWPIMLLMLLTGILYARSPNTCLIAIVSVESFSPVPVPCALM